MAHTLTHGTTPASLGSYKYTTPVEDTASFMGVCVARGRVGRVQQLPAPAFIPEFGKDYGVPLDATYVGCAPRRLRTTRMVGHGSFIFYADVRSILMVSRCFKGTAVGSAVFARKWSHADVGWRFLWVSCKGVGRLRIFYVCNVVFIHNKMMVICFYYEKPVSRF